MTKPGATSGCRRLVLLSSETRWVQLGAARLCCQPHACVRLLDGTPSLCSSWLLLVEPAGLRSEACVVKKSPSYPPSAEQQNRDSRSLCDAHARAPVFDFYLS